SFARPSPGRGAWQSPPPPRRRCGKPRRKSLSHGPRERRKCERQCRHASTPSPCISVTENVGAGRRHPSRPLRSGAQRTTGRQTAVMAPLAFLPGTASITHRLALEALELGDLFGRRLAAAGLAAQLAQATGTSIRLVGLLPRVVGLLPRLV